MHKALTLSVIIPAFNEEAHISACLAAISEQTVKPHEVIVVDNNSTDSTAIIASRFPFVKVVREVRQGLYFSRETGMRIATGDILCRIDADAIVNPYWVENISRAFTSDQSMVALTGPVGYYDMPAPQFTLALEHLLLKIALMGDNKFLFGCNMAIRRDVWTQIADGLCNRKDIFEDLDIAIHLRRRGLAPSYEKGMNALVSARRFADTPQDFNRYIKGHTRTFIRHGDTPVVGAYFAEFTFKLVYFFVKPLHLVYDPHERKINLRRLAQSQKARPDPMSVD